MAILTSIFLLFLFIITLISTLFKIPIKKIQTLFQFQLQSRFQSRFDQDSIKNQENTQKQSINKNPARKDELKSVFATFDKNKDGFITKQELSDSLKNIGISTSEKDVVEMVQRVDVNGDGLIDFGEFCELFDSMVSREDENPSSIDGEFDHKDGDLKDAFDVFDSDKNGVISVEELGMVLCSLGFKEGKKMENCRNMISKVDIDGDGMINFHEFKNMMKNGGGFVSVS